MKKPEIKGFKENMAESDYRSAEGVGSTMLRKLSVSPLHAITESPGSTFPFGTALHAALLEPQLFNEKVAVISDGRTKVGKQEKAEAIAQGKVTISEKDNSKLTQIKATLAQRPRAEVLLRTGKRELACFAKHPFVDVQMKGRLDAYHPKLNLIVDVKTVSPMSKEAIGNHIYQSKYHWQADWYSQIVQQITGRPQRFVFVFVQDREPWDIYCMELHPSAMDMAREQYEPKLVEYVECKRSGEFYGLAGPEEDVGLIDMPNWAWGKDD